MGFQQVENEWREKTSWYHLFQKFVPITQTRWNEASLLKVEVYIGTKYSCLSQGGNYWSSVRLGSAGWSYYKLEKSAFRYINCEE